MDLKEIGWGGGHELCWIASRWGHVTECCEKCNEFLDFMKFCGIS